MKMADVPSYSNTNVFSTLPVLNIDIAILAAPFAFESLQRSLSGLRGRRSIDVLYILGKFTFIFPDHMPAAVF